MAGTYAGVFVIKVDVLLSPPAPFCRFFPTNAGAGVGPCGDKTSIPDYLKGRGYDPVVVDAGPPGAITAPETRTITITLGKLGASQMQAEQDVLDSFNNVGWTGRVTRAVSRGAKDAADAATSAVDKLGSAFSTYMLLALAGIVLIGVVYVKRG